MKKIALVTLLALVMYCGVANAEYKYNDLLEDGLDYYSSTAATSGTELSLSEHLTVAKNLAVGGTAIVTGAISGATVDTGQGANELYDMDQNVLTTSDVTFNNITASGTFTGDLVGTADNATEAAGVALGYEASDTTCFPLFAEATSSPTSASYNTSFKFNSSSKALECADLNLTDDLSVQDTILSYGTATLNDLLVSVNATVTGDLQVDGGVLQVDADNNYVGVNKAVPAVALDVVGNANISQDVSIDGTCKATSFSGATGATGSMAITGSVDISADLTVDGETDLAGDLLAPVRTLSKSGDYTLTTTDMRGSVIYCDAELTLTGVSVFDGGSCAIEPIGDVAVTFKPNASDYIILDGTVLDDADRIISGGNSGEGCVITYFSADGWHAQTGDKWSDAS